MTLTTYKNKRKFTETPEPEGKTKTAEKELIFVVQRHKATRLHYDFRLELEGVLKSWAVPKGPSMNHTDKRLAMMVEDHPYDYKDFEGVIPEGNYGAGIVEIWDKGTYTPLKETKNRKQAEHELLEGIKNGNLKIRLNGKKLKGEFALVKIKNQDAGDKAWLMIKHRDNFAVMDFYDSENMTPVNSPINKWLRQKKEKETGPKKNIVAHNPPFHSTKKAKKPLKKGERILELKGTEVRITNFEKIYFPEDGTTKGMIVDYYQEIAEFILPYLKNRPQSLKRNPNGIRDQGFFHKDAGEAAPDFVDRIPIYSESSKKDIEYILCNNNATLAYMNNLGCIEINPWHSTTKALDQPDYLIIDIDPSPGNTFDEVIEAARVVKSILDKCSIPGFCKTSGATGIHIYIPLYKKYIYTIAQDFANVLCILVHEAIPGITSLERNLEKRGSKIYMDYMQNRKSQTIASVYSVRPYPGATVSTPLEWTEIKNGLNPREFTMKTVVKRLQKKGDLFKGVLGKGIDIKHCMKVLAPSFE